MNIIIGKLSGVGTLFGGDYYKDYGGDIIAKLFMDMVIKHPEHNYYVATSNDISKTFSGLNAINKPKNLIDYYTRQKLWCKTHGYKINDDESYKMLESSLIEDNIKIDKVIIQGISLANTSLWGLNYTYDGSRLRSPLMCSRSGAQIIYFISMNKDISCSFIVDDPRFFLNYPIDLLKKPNSIVSQFNETIRVKVYNGYGIESKTLKEIELVCKYSHLEKYVLRNKQKIDWRDDKRTNKFIMTLHGLPDRVKLIKKWVYDFDRNIKIYGNNWTTNKSTVNVVNKLNIPFTIFENCPICDIEDLLWNSKYTYIPPVSLKYTAFVTQKVWVMLYYGIIPFWCKDEYDTSNIYTVFPEFLKVKSPTEMWDKINFLEQNIEEYNKLRNQLYDILKDEYFNSDFILNEIEKIIY